MKKIAGSLLVILTVMIFLYLAKPKDSPQPLVEQQQVELAAGPIATEQGSAKSVKEILEVIVDDKQCKDLSEIKELRKQLTKELKAQLKQLEQQGVGQKDLYNLARYHLKAPGLANDYRAKKAQEIIRPEIFAGKGGGKLLEELMLASLAGEGEKYIAQFQANKIEGMNAANAEHRILLANVLLMGNPKQAPKIVEQLFSSRGPLPNDLLSILVDYTNDTKLIESLLPRFSDLNHRPTVNVFGLNSANSRSLLSNAISAGNYQVAELLIDHGSRPSVTDYGPNEMDYIRYNPGQVPVSLVNKMLDKGFVPGRASSAKYLAEKFSKIDPLIGQRFAQLEQQQATVEQEYLEKLPSNAKAVLDDYRYESNKLKELDAICAKQVANKDTIPVYQPIDTKWIEQEVKQMLAAKLSPQEIISSLAGLNKETVEYAYKLLKQLKNEKSLGSDRNGFANIPEQARALVGFIKQEDWQGLIEQMKKTNFKGSNDFNAGNMLMLMISKDVEENYVAQMAGLADKTDSLLVFQARRKPETMQRLINYGFNINSSDQENKNLFYHAVKRNSADELEQLVNWGVALVSDPFGYDPLDYLLRRNKPRTSTLMKLVELNFPITEQHLDYSLYLKTYYPERYQKLIEAMPELKVSGKWLVKDE